MTNIERA